MLISLHVSWSLMISWNNSNVVVPQYRQIQQIAQRLRIIGDELDADQRIQRYELLFVLLNTTLKLIFRKTHWRYTRMESSLACSNSLSLFSSSCASGKYFSFFQSRMVDQVPINSPYETFSAVAKELFCDGIYNWGRIVILFYFTYKLILKVDWTSKFVSRLELFGLF